MSIENEIGYVPSNNTNFEPVKEGDYDAVVQAVISLGRQEVPKYVGDKPHPTQKDVKSQIRIVFELPDSVRDDEDKTPNVIGKKINVTDHLEKGNFALMLKTLGIKVNNKAELISMMSQSGFSKMLGKAVRLTIENWEKDNGDQGASIAKGGINKLDPRLPQPTPVREAFVFNPRKPDIDIFKTKLSQYTREEIMKAVDSDQFPAELHKAWAEVQAERLAEGKDTKKTKSSQAVDTVPWEGDTGAIE